MGEYPEPLKTARPANTNEIIINLNLRDAPLVALSKFNVNIDADDVLYCDDCNAESAWLVIEFLDEDGYEDESKREISICCGNCVSEEFRELWHANPQNPPGDFSS